MHIGIDVHGCIDLYLNIFRRLSCGLKEIGFWQYKRSGHRISIITDQEWKKVKPEVDRLGICYTDHFSIVDYHKSIGTKMWTDAKGTFWMDNDIWIKSKGIYIEKEHVDVHFDDSVSYARYVPDTCTFVLVPKTGFHQFVELFFDDAYFNKRS